jgi:hypothetical protein
MFPLVNCRGNKGVKIFEQEIKMRVKRSIVMSIRGTTPCPFPKQK